MQHPLRAALLFPTLCLTLLVHCRADSEHPTNNDASCEALSDKGRARMSAVIAAHTSCVVDTDCRSVDLSAGCFDSCSRVMSADGEAALADARRDANNVECKFFNEKGCKLIIPPCIAPGSPACINGACSAH